jgi:hypothetical protein
LPAASITIYHGSEISPGRAMEIAARLPLSTGPTRAFKMGPMTFQGNSPENFSAVPVVRRELVPVLMPGRRRRESFAPVLAKLRYRLTTFSLRQPSFNLRQSGPIEASWQDYSRRPQPKDFE